MKLDCPRCSHVLHYEAQVPRFCSNCGLPLSDSSLEATTPGGGPLPYDPQATVASPEAAATAAHPGTVGGYRLLRTLGGGGMGTVYEAEEAGSSRRVALKLIRPEFAEASEAVERFRREGRLASTIIHPRCVFVLAADEQAGRPYIVMELMPGRNLHDLVGERGPLPVAEAVGKILDVIDGLQEAHRRGVIHRDVKPSNCFLDESGRVKVGDFGLAKSLVGPEVLTRSGAFLGTLLFASPEQIRNEPLTAQTDVYSVCATLYYLLTGRAPFQGDDDDPAATLARTVTDPLPSARTHRPELPRALDEIIRRGLARPRSRRWKDLEELRLALLPFVSVSHSLDEVGWRACAYLFDLLLIVPVELVALRLLGTAGPGGPALEYPARLMASLFLSLLCGLGYFALAEWLWGATPGKLLMRLRVREVKGHDRPRLWRAALRTAVFYLFKDLGVVLAGLWLVLPGGRLMGEGPVTAWLMLGIALLAVLPFLSSALGTALLAVTMRRRNGFRAVHELLSGTETIRLPAPRPRPAVPDRSLAERGTLPEGVPATVGAFGVRAVLYEGHDERVLACEDGALGRPVWLWMRRGEAALPPGRAGLAREARPRWLACGEQDGWRWDAFVAPSGCLLADLVNRRKRLSWAEAQALLAELAEELEAARADGTLPTVLGAMQVWVHPSGRPLLADVPLRAGSPASSPLDLLRRTAALALEGEVRSEAELAEPIRAPLPGHASELMDRLTGAGPPFASPGEARAALAEAHGRPTEISRPARAFQVLLSAAALGPGLLWTFGLGVMFLMVAYLFTIAGLAGSRAVLQTLDPDSPDPTVQRQREDYEALEARLRGDRTLVLQSWSGYLRERLIGGEGDLLRHYAEMLHGDPEQSGDALLELGDDLLAGPRLLAELTAREAGAVLGAFLFWPLAWALWAGLTRGGLAMRLAGVGLRNRDGRPAARWRCAARSLAAWMPVAALLLLSFWLDVWRLHHGPDEANARLLALAAWLAWWAWWQALLLLPLYAWMAVRWPNRGLHDRLAGTYPVAA